MVLWLPFFILVGLPPSHYWMYELAELCLLGSFILLLSLIKLIFMRVLFNCNSYVSLNVASILLCQLLLLLFSSTLIRLRFILLFSSLLNLNWILLVRIVSNQASLLLLINYTFLIQLLIPLLEYSRRDRVSWQRGFILLGLPPSPFFIMKLLFNLELIGLNLLWFLFLCLIMTPFYTFYFIIQITLLF